MVHPWLHLLPWTKGTRTTTTKDSVARRVPKANQVTTRSLFSMRGWLHLVNLAGRPGTKPGKLLVAIGALEDLMSRSLVA